MGLGRTIEILKNGSQSLSDARKFWRRLLTLKRKNLLSERLSGAFLAKLEAYPDPYWERSRWR